jgi:hypothetical protein
MNETSVLFLVKGQSCVKDWDGRQEGVINRSTHRNSSLGGGFYRRNGWNAHLSSTTTCEDFIFVILSIPTSLPAHPIHKILFLFILFCIYHITMTMIIKETTGAAHIHYTTHAPRKVIYSSI